jgi:pyruvate/2-oxoglutarate dehydrogenase complex dihydrolipoamide dehydrogenase (E3) component/uncharacterized membrane protein YdjX (TVP38/TMEM64 family)
MHALAERRLLIVVLAVLCLWAAYRYLDVSDWLSLEQLKSSRQTLSALYEGRPIATSITFFALYVTAAALSVPGASMLTLAAGAIFGFSTGLFLVSFASSIGALFAFWMSRYLLRDLVSRRFGRFLKTVNEGLKKDGVHYLLTVRLVPVFPFWLVNLLMGLTSIRAWRFYIVSQIGMIAATAVYVYAGTQIAAINNISDILSIELLISFLLLGLFPWLAKWTVLTLKKRKLYAPWSKPRRFDRNLVIIGAGAGGLVSAYIAAAVRAKVTLIESHKMGGDCLNYGCVPSKALIKVAKLADLMRKAASFGLGNASVAVDFRTVMQRVQKVIRTIEPHDSVDRYTELGVEVLRGHARITSPWTVSVREVSGSEKVLSTRNIVIAAGASPLIPAIPGLGDVGFVTSDTIWELETLPARLVVLGGGPVGCELAQSFARLGSRVIQVEMATRLMAREDPEVSELLESALRADGVKLLTNHRAIRAEMVAGQKRLVVKSGDQESIVVFDELLCAVGRRPRVTGYGLEDLDIALSPSESISSNACLQTRFPNIYAVGDVVGPFQFTHVAAHQAWYAVVNALFGRFKRFKVDYAVIPRTIFTDPEIARVGLSESEARAGNIPYELTTYRLDELDRAIADGSVLGFVRLLTVPGKDKILGVTIVGEHAGDLLAEYVLAMKHGLGLNKILGTIHSYPTFSEANKYAAGAWKKAHAPERILNLLARFHAWERR